MMKHVSLGPNTIVHKVAEVGEEIKTGETLLEFTTSFDDPAFLTNLAQTMG